MSSDGQARQPKLRFPGAGLHCGATWLLFAGALATALLFSAMPWLQFAEGVPLMDLTAASPALRLVAKTELDALAAQAKASQRGRAHLILHESMQDSVQRFFVAVDPRSYICPHRHTSGHELAVVVRGRFALLMFDDAGHVVARHALSADGPSTYEAPAGVWHSLVALSDGATFLEVRQGPYDPATATEFAPWAPREGTHAVPHFHAWLTQARPGEAPPAI